jgi:predicted RNase H-like nuclease (RuvC/YqgF family)
MHRILIVLCIVGFGGAAAMAILRMKSEDARKDALAQLAAETTRAQTIAAELGTAQEQAGALTSRVRALESEVTATKAKVTASDARAGQFERELAQARVTVSVHEQNTRALATEIATLRQDLADTRAANASPEAVAAYKNTIAELERQLAQAQNGAATPGIAGASTAVLSSRVSQASVLTVGPGNAFVVLNFGSDRGAQLGQKLTVNQGTDVVATVLISDVRPNFSIAQVLPDSLRGVLQKGDSAVLLR